jgi:hypothetical protein
MMQKFASYVKKNPGDGLSRNCIQYTVIYSRLGWVFLLLAHIKDQSIIWDVS